MKRTVLILTSLLIGSMAPAQSPAFQGSALHRALEGVWCNSNDGGKTCWAYDEFFSTGVFVACGQTEDDQRAFRGSGRFEVQGSRMCYVVAAASENFWVKPGSRYCTDIISIDAHSHRYRDIDTGAEFTLYRRRLSDKACPPDEQR